MLTAAAMAALLFFLGMLYAFAHKGHLHGRDAAISGLTAALMTVIALLWPDTSLQPNWEGTATVLRWLSIVCIVCIGCRVLLRKRWQQAFLYGVFGGTWLTVVFTFWIWS